jgi:hypothetical protein
MVRPISKGHNLFAPDLDGITLPLLKLEKESASRMIITMMGFKIFTRKFSIFGKWERQS